MKIDIFQIVITLLGALAIFIYGMNLLSDGLQKAAGDKMRSVLAMLTAKPIFGVLSGALVTAVLQSSSATTVMVIGFTSAGLMKLPQAISVIMGANIGTTITAQLIAFKIGDYAWIFVIVGFLMYFFVKKKELIKDIGQILFGFGILFVGMNIMSQTMKPLAHLPIFSELMLQVADIPVLGVLIGTTMTIVVQSSSATIAVLQNLASTPGPDGIHSLIGLNGSLPILFGDNIGTTITALLASIGASINAKRTAVAHSVFNILGTLIFIWFIPQLAFVVKQISGNGTEVQVIARQIANAHFIFNFVNMLLWLPFVWLLVKIVVKIVPGEDPIKPTFEPLYLDEKVINQPVFGIYLAIQELSRVGKMALEMLEKSKKAFLSEDMTLIKEVINTDEYINNLRTKTINYLAMLLSSESITEGQKERVSGLFHVAGDIEHIGDYCKNIAKLAKEKNKNNYTFSDQAYSEIYQCFDMAENMLKVTLDALENSDVDKANKILEMEEDLNHLEIQLRKDHMVRLYDKTCSPAFTMIYTDTIHNAERIGDSCKNIAQSVLKGATLKGTAQNPVSSQVINEG